MNLRTHAPLFRQVGNTDCHDYKASIGGGISNEYDFQSASVNGAISKDLNDKNTTLSAGLSLELDNLNPVGGKPKSLSSMSANIKEGSDNKTVVDALLGITQVINRKMIMQWNYCLLYTSPSPRDRTRSRMPSSA